jgi:hypothetical protein
MRNTVRCLSVAAGCTALLVLAGCQTPPQICEAPGLYNVQAGESSGIAPGSPQPLTAIGRRGVRVIDGITNVLYVEEVRAGRRANGAVEVAVRLLNCSGAPVQFEGATQFFDAAGSVAEAPTVWKRVFVPPRSSRDYSEISTGPRAASFIVDIRGGT